MQAITPFEEKRQVPLWESISRKWALIMLMVCIGMTISTAKLIQNDGIKGDGTQNLTIAFSLYKDRTFSFGEAPHYEPTNFREPLPPFVLAVYLKAFQDITSPFTHMSLQHGDHARFVKLHNLLWVFLGLTGSWLLFNALANTRLLGGAAAFIVYVLYYNSAYTVNTLYTELIAAAMLIWLSLTTVHAMRAPRTRNWILVGWVFGMLILTKAVFIYVTPFLILLIATCNPRPKAATFFQRAIAPGLLMLLGATLLTAPWMFRNFQQFGSPQLTQGRSGWVLYKRALLNDMGEDEFRRGFTLWGPKIYQDLVANTSLGLKPEEAKTWTGPLRRLYYGKSEFIANDLDAQHKGNPQQAVTLYRKTSALYVELSRMFKEAGHPNPNVAGDRVMQDVAMKRIVANPIAHLKVSALMFWRGIWFFSPYIDLPPLTTTDEKRNVVEILNFLSTISLFYLLAAGLIKKNAGWIALTAPSIFMIGFYTLTSQNLPRFLVPAQPLMLLALMLTLTQLFGRNRAAGGGRNKNFTPN